MTLDIVLGIAAGCIAGGLLPRAINAAWRWGWGPQRLGTAGQVLIACAATLAVAAALLLGLTLPLKPIVENWRRFVSVWGVAFIGAMVMVVFLRKGDAA